METQAWMPFFTSSLIKYFFLLTPFFAVSVFLALTKGDSGARRRRLAAKATLAMVVVCVTCSFSVILFSRCWE